MATVKRYPLNQTAIKELIGDLDRFREHLEEAPREIVDKAVTHAENYFNGYLTGATPGRQAVIDTNTSVEARGKYGAVGRLTALGKTEDTGFNILMAVEFGAGIAGVDGSANTSFDVGMGTGTWPGQTHAFDSIGWLFPTGEYDARGKEIYRRTLGTPATMPMHRTIQDMKAEMPELVRGTVRRWLI